MLSFFYMTYLIFYVKLALDLAAALYVGFFLSYMISSLVMRMVFRSTFVEKKLNLAEMIFCVPFLFGVYWWLPYLCITNVDTPMSPQRAFLSAVLFNVGLVTIISTEAQISYTLANEPQALMADKSNSKSYMLGYYVGQFILYFSFAILARAYEAYVILALMFFVVFVPHNLLKETRVAQNALDYAKYGMYSPLDVLLIFESDDSGVLDAIAEESGSEMKAESEVLQTSNIKRRVEKH